MNKKQVIDKVRKLFALGRSVYKAEAELAVAKAHEMLAKYNLSMKELDVEDKKFILSDALYGKANRPSWQVELLCTIADHFMVDIMIQSRGRGRKNSFLLVGTEVNVDLANYTLNYLLSVYKMLADEYMKKTKNEDSSFHSRRRKISYRVKERSSYYFGLNRGLKLTLIKQVKNEEERGIVLAKDQDLAEFIKDLAQGRSSKLKNNADIDALAYIRGTDDGQQIKLKGGLTDESKAVKKSGRLGGRR